MLTYTLYMNESDKEKKKLDWMLLDNQFLYAITCKDKYNDRNLFYTEVICIWHLIVEDFDVLQTVFV